MIAEIGKFSVFFETLVVIVPYYYGTITTSVSSGRLLQSLSDQLKQTSVPRQ